MALTSDQAAEVAARHGLDLSDAAALRALADDETSAEKIAARFAVSASDDKKTAERRRWLRNLEGRR